MERTDEFLSVGQVAEHLNVSANTIYSWVRLKRIPFYRLGGLIRFSRHDLEAWAEGNRQPHQVAS